MDSDDAEFPHDDGADLDQLGRIVSTGGLGQLGAGERQAPDRLHERVRDRREEQAPLVRPPAVGAHPVGEEHHLLLHPVLHLAPGAVALVVDLLRIADDVRQYEARIRSLLRVLGLGDHPARRLPGERRIVEGRKEPLLLARSDKLLLAPGPSAPRPWPAAVRCLAMPTTYFTSLLVAPGRASGPGRSRCPPGTRSSSAATLAAAV